MYTQFCSMLDTLAAKVSGRKTYIAAILMAVYALTGLYTGFLGGSEATEVLLTAFAVAGLRNAITPPGGASDVGQPL